MRVDKRVELRWTGEGQAFSGAGASGGPVTIDGDSEDGPGPMDTLLLGLAACMGIDVLMILEKSRVPVEDLSVIVEGERAEKHPRRYTAIRILYSIAGPGEEHEARLQRAVDLSKDRYCSVLHSLRTDIDITVAIDRG
jgi:putative redox protein